VSCFQVLDLPVLPPAFSYVAPFEFADKRDPRWYYYVSSSCCHAFAFLTQRLGVVAFALVAWMDGDQAP
jgi:hypothetical protein